MEITYDAADTPFPNCICIGDTEHRQNVLLLLETHSPGESVLCWARQKQPKYELTRILVQRVIASTRSRTVRRIHGGYLCLAVDYKTRVDVHEDASYTRFWLHIWPWQMCVCVTPIYMWKQRASSSCVSWEMFWSTWQFRTRFGVRSTPCNFCRINEFVYDRWMRGALMATTNRNM